MGEFSDTTIEIENMTLVQLLEMLSRELGENFIKLVFDNKTGEISQHVSVLVNGRHYTHLPEGLDTALQDSDEVAMFPPIAGGLAL